MQKSKAEKAADKALHERVKKVQELLADFGVTLCGIDPGVTGSIAGQTGRGPGYWGEQLSLDKRAWDWIKPLLEELRTYKMHSLGLQPKSMRTVGPKLSAVKLCEKRVEEKRTYGTVAWTVGDVMSLAEDCKVKMTEKEAEEFLARNAKFLAERLTEVGWEVLETYLNMDQTEKMQKKARRSK